MASSSLAGSKVFPPRHHKTDRDASELSLLYGERGKKISGRREAFLCRVCSCRFDKSTGFFGPRFPSLLSEQEGAGRKKFFILTLQLIAAKEMSALIRSYCSLGRRNPRHQYTRGRVSLAVEGRGHDLRADIKPANSDPES